MRTLCLIIPCYNEEERIKEDPFKRFLKENPGLDLLFVNDGSEDGTQFIIDNICNEFSNARNLSLNSNQGKGQAIRQGILDAISTDTYEFVGYLDADLATPLSEVNRLLKSIMKRPEVVIALGSRWKHLGAQINRNWLRHYMGRLFATVVSLLFNMSVYDTQCGAKIIRNRELTRLFEVPFISKWFFDIEILIRLKKNKAHLPIDQWAMEVPLQFWNEIGDSRVRIRDFISVPIQLLRIKKAYG